MTKNITETLNLHKIIISGINKIKTLVICNRIFRLYLKNKKPAIFMFKKHKMPYQ